ncbi:hypothetical protein Hamer_G002323 [Homarus americanus]|uniref:Uncharacterized protein n=1 Tax=Homarus americanus TaxID=6706 RepID=A0A8J5K326_HOMAM|nr:hypothetical protein Hamer_G002323 [Homarus americanus]
MMMYAVHQVLQCEIENLHAFVGDKSRWLSDKLTNLGNALLQQVNISSVCQANETCSSFNDCVCQNNCRETALEKLQQSANFRAKTSRKRTMSESEGSRPILAHMKDKNTQEKDEKDKEKCSNEKESQITTEALSDALKKQVRDNKLEEMEAINKKQWLSCSSDSSPIMKKCGVMAPPRLPESVLYVASWCKQMAYEKLF